MSLISELKRRKVIRVGIAYLALAWLVVQVAETLLPAYGFDDAAIRVLVAVLAVGLVLALVLAWIYEWTPEGVRLTPKTGDEEATPRTARRAPNTVIAAIVVLAAAAAAWLAFRSLEVGPAEANTIAVLPFSTLGQSEADVFTDGMHVGVLTRLSNVSDLVVISRASVMAYRATDRPLPEIGMELGAAWVLQGDVQQAGDRVLVSASLSDARQDRQVWAEEYQRTLTTANIFDIQADITRRIVGALQARLTRQEEERMAAVPTADLEAYRLYQQGRDLLDRRTPDGMRRSLEYFENAVVQDPGYALAWAGLGDASALLFAYGHETDRAYLERGAEAIDQALALDQALPEAWAVRGLLHYQERDLPAAIRNVDRAIELRPSYAQAHTWRAFFHGLLGEFSTSLESSFQAVQLNPRSPEAIVNYASANLDTGHPDIALTEGRRALDLAPDWPNTRLVMGVILLGTGQPRAAVEHLEGLSVNWAGAGAETSLALAYLALGQEDRARDLRPRIEARGDPYGQAVMAAVLDSLDQGYARLGEIEEWPGWATFSFRGRQRHLWNPDGADPRYGAMLQRIDESWGVER